MRKGAKTWLTCVLAAAAMSATDAAADTIVIRGNSGGLVEHEFNNFYAGEGHTSFITSFLVAPVTAGADLLVIPMPLTTLAAFEIDAILDHLAAGRRVAIFGDYAAWSPLVIGSINAALGSLGSAYSQTNETHTGGGTATVLNGQLPAHPLTAGIVGLSFAAFGTIAGVGPGEAFLLGPDLSDVIGAEEHLGGGSLVLVLDTAVTGSPLLLRNLLDPVGGTPIPEPGTLALLVAAAGLGFALRRRRAKS